jgi:hypothetical protein
MMATELAVDGKTNVMCKRSSMSSLFSREFLDPSRRSETLAALANWRPARSTPRVEFDYQVKGSTEFSGAGAFLALVRSLLVLPFKFVWMLFCNLAIRLEYPVIIPLTAWLSAFLKRHYVLYNFISKPLIDIGILFELALCYLFFYSPLSRIYYFAPVPWHVYLFAFHGLVLLLVFEEVKKYYRRKGFRLEILG